MAKEPDNWVLNEKLDRALSEISALKKQIKDLEEVFEERLSGIESKIS